MEPPLFHVQRRFSGQPLTGIASAMTAEALPSFCVVLPKPPTFLGQTAIAVICHMPLFCARHMLQQPFKTNTTPPEFLGVS